MPETVDYKGYYLPADSVPTEIMDEWETTLKGERARILLALLEKISNASEYIDRLATPSADAWANFVSDTYPDADFIKLKQRVKIKSAYDAWNSGVQAAFAEGGTFETNVTNKKDKFQKARYTLGAVGLKYLLGWGVSYKAIGYITGDSRVALYLTGEDAVTGTPQNIFPTDVVKYVRPMGIAIFNQGLILAYYAHEAGLSSERDAIISAINTKFSNSLLKLYDDANWQNVAIEIAYDSVADKIYAHVHAEPIT